MLKTLLESVLFFRDGHKAFFDPESYPWVATVEAEWTNIRRELESLLTRREEIPNFQDISDAQKDLTEGEQWKTFWFYAYGQKADANCARCPETIRALQHIPGMKSAMFSILAPKKHIPEHRGIVEGRIALPSWADCSRTRGQLKDSSGKRRAVSGKKGRA